MYHSDRTMSRQRISGAQRWLQLAKVIASQLIRRRRMCLVRPRARVPSLSMLLGKKLTRKKSDIAAASLSETKPSTQSPKLKLLERPCRCFETSSPKEAKLLRNNSTPPSASTASLKKSDKPLVHKNIQPMMIDNSDPTSVIGDTKAEHMNRIDNDFLI